MAVAWTQHRFSGGLLALDLANTVVLRGRPGGFDRLAEPAEIARFAQAAERFRAEELGGRRLTADHSPAVAARIVEIREAIDALFRHCAQTGALDTRLLPRFLRACANALEQTKLELSDGRAPLDAVLALSALSLLDEARRQRVRICPNCNWLFLDRSRNGSRIWCDMTVCGNRQKARRHYRRARKPGSDVDAGQ